MANHIAVPAHRRTRRARVALVLVAALAISGVGCSAMEGVNVGASVPIGGIGSVGASTTVGGRSAPGQKPAPAPETSEDADDEEQEAGADQ